MKSANSPIKNPQNARQFLDIVIRSEQCFDKAKFHTKEYCVKYHTARYLFGVLINTLFIANTVNAFDIIAHRGASGFVPEHTLEAAVMAYAQNPNYIEQDVVLTADEQAIVLHDIYLETVTDVEQVFPNRKREDGRWYAIDFTLDEIKKLRVHERQDLQGNQVFSNRYSGSGHFTVATFEEHISTIISLNKTTGKHIGIYPEIKSPAFHRAEGKDISKIVISILQKYGLNTQNEQQMPIPTPVIVQCFDFEEVKRLKTKLGLKTKLIQLIAENEWNEAKTDFDWLKSKDGLKTVSQYVDGVGPWFLQLVQPSKTGQWQATAFSQRLLNSGLMTHPYTFRHDALPPGVTTHDVLNTLSLLGADGVFTDQVPTVKQWLIERLEP